MLNNTVVGIPIDDKLESLLGLCRVLGIRYRIEPTTVPGSDKFVVETETILPIGFFYNCKHEERGLTVVCVEPKPENIRMALISGISHIFVDLSHNMSTTMSMYEMYVESWKRDFHGVTLCVGESQ